MKQGRPLKADGQNVVMSVKIPIYQKVYLARHCELTGNKLSEIIKVLIDYYIQEGGK